MNTEEKDRLTRKLLGMLHNPWFLNPKNTLINSCVRDVKKEIPQYPEFLWVGGCKDISSKKLYKIGSATILEDLFGSLGYLPRQILLEDGRGMDSSIGKPFDELLKSVKNGQKFSIDMFKPYEQLA